MAQLFLSYRVGEAGAGGDRTVQRLDASLRRRGYTSFVGEQSLYGGDKWPMEIQTALLACQVCAGSN